MGKRISIDEKIVKVRNDRYELLSLVSDSIKNNRNILISDIKSLSDVLEYDEKTVKRYEAVVKAQELIASLTEEICYAKTADEIIELRKKINSCINKIKNELKRRNVSEEYLLKYQESANFLRKDIAKFIRVIKREDTINNILDLHKNYEIMTDEEKEQFKKMVGREYRYNRRNLNPKEDNQKSKRKEETLIQPEVIEPVEEVILKSPIVDEIEDNNLVNDGENIFQINNSVVEEFIPEVTEEKVIEGVVTESFGEQILSFQIPSDPVEEIVTNNDTRTVNRVVNSISDVTESDMEFLKIKLKSYDNRYNIRSPYSYGKTLFNGISSVIKNIPIYRANKQTIKQMTKESQCESDFISYVAYLTKINSLRHGLKSIFSRSYLASSEVQLLNDHERCAEWILNFCERNSLQINFLNRTLIR